MSGIEVLLPIILMLVLLLLGIPVAYSLLVSGMIGVISTVGLNRSLGIFLTAPYAQVSDYLLSAIPMFILMAMFLSKGGMAKDLFRFAQHWLGHVPGGLAIATTITNGFVAVLSGSSSATAASMAKMSYAEMEKYGYDKRLIMGTVSAAGTFAVMLPPSIALIIYGIFTEENIGDLFTAGLIPGIITLIGYVITIIIWVQYSESTSDIEIASVERYGWETRLSSLKKVYPLGFIAIFVLGAIYSGVVTVTEAGAFGASLTLLTGIIKYDLSFTQIREALYDTLEINGMIFIIMIGASIFGYYVTLTRIPRLVLDTITAFPIGPYGVLALILLLYLILGTFIDQLAVLIMTLPITYPIIVTEMGFNGIWFGIVIVKTIEVGLVSPPFGLNVYIASGAVDINAEIGFRGALRFIIVDLIIIALLLAFPSMMIYY